MKCDYCKENFDCEDISTWGGETICIICFQGKNKNLYSKGTFSHDVWELADAVEKAKKEFKIAIMNSWLFRKICKGKIK